MNDWAGLGYDGEPIVYGLFVNERPSFLYTEQLPVMERNREFVQDRREGLSTMDVIWETV